MNDQNTPVRKVATSDVDIWSQIRGRQIYVSDIIDQGSAPAAKMTVGFARVGDGEKLDISFPYDEVLIVTQGSYTVTTQYGEVITAGPGEVIYLPAGSSNTSHATQDTEMVYVANPPSVYADHVAASAAAVTSPEHDVTAPLASETAAWPS